MDELEGVYFFIRYSWDSESASKLGNVYYYSSIAFLITFKFDGFDSMAELGPRGLRVRTVSSLHCAAIMLFQIHIGYDVDNVL